MKSTPTCVGQHPLLDHVADDLALAEGAPVGAQGHVTERVDTEFEPMVHVASSRRVVSRPDRTAPTGYRRPSAYGVGSSGANGTTMAGASVPPSISNTLPVTHDEASEAR